MTHTHSSPFVVIIPARYGSTRLPGKPLLPIGDRPMVQWVYENARQAGAQEVIVATDDERIRAAVTGFGGTAVMTDTTHRSGTDRIAQVCAERGFSDDTIIVNLQGDEPQIPPALMQLVAEALFSNEEAGISTLATPIATVEDLFNPNVVKVLLDERGMAHYFSRAPVPWPRDAFLPLPQIPAALPAKVPFLRHLGLYAYKASALRAMADHRATPLEVAESLEQLRALAMGIRIHVSVIEKAPGHGVDTEADLRRVHEMVAP